MVVTYTEITVQGINTTYDDDETAVGCDPTFTDHCAIGASTGNKFDNTGREYIEIHNDDASHDLTVTVNDQSACDHGFDHDVVFKVPQTSGKRKVGPFPVGWFTSTCLITYDSAWGGTSTDTSIGVFKLPITSPKPE